MNRQELKHVLKSTECPIGKPTRERRALWFLCRGHLESATREFDPEPVAARNSRNYLPRYLGR